ncbi:hypothetical protein A0J61_08272 [Choanephora cucurbitarum]|uniref:Uncharacterized protein n=1 Tax=Choanephora cucurbitarum TaxID=101091 RepID=A0A1C7N3M4_9FUNG|nr:hypothetical protein A0J61_08272 [Choanephora cucurbitarum]
MIRYRNWTSNTLTEEDFGIYWKYIIEILFRGSPVILKRGESCSTSTRVERQVNELEYGASIKSVYGRKIDLLFVAPIVNDALQEELIELGALEIKPAPVSESVEVIQLNKNIRVNKSILHDIHSHAGNCSTGNLHVLGIDIVGLSAYIYEVKQFKDIAIACKASEENIFLPGDEDDFEDFVFADSLDQLLNYMIIM